jgi:hypothetical protein|nr:MAG TPA: hypothetical protein [Caudoviricetes sp.]
MKTTMRDKVCQLIGKYQYLEDYYKTKAAINTQKSFLDGGFIIRLAEPAQADMCGQFLADLNKLLEEDEAAAAQEDPRKTAPAGKWCADSAAQAAESAAKEGYEHE